MSRMTTTADTTYTRVPAVVDADDVQARRRVLVSEPSENVRVSVIDDDGREQTTFSLPPVMPDWAMDPVTHNTSCSRTATYRCTQCGGEHEEYRQNPRELPYAKVCGCAVEATETSTELVTCTAPALRRVAYPGEGIALNARRFEQLSVFEVANWESRSDDFKRSHQRYYVPGRNYEPTEPGMIRHDLTNIQSYNRFIKTVNAHELQKMRDHRDMHREYWGARRKALREDVNARLRPLPLLMSIARMVRARSDQKSDRRYGGSLDPKFHSHLIEFDQGKLQAWTDKETGWRDRRAR